MFEHVRREGNFKLSSGRTSKYFYDFDLLRPEEHLDACEKLHQGILQKYTVMRPENVVAPSVGGVIPGFLIAGALGAKLTIVDHDGVVRGEKPHCNYLIVDDVVTSFGTLDRIREICGDEECLGAAAYIFRGSDADLEAGRKKYDVLFFLDRKEVEE